jgi:methylated-DNA-[protein]-cysteine S-methyltransferase
MSVETENAAGSGPAPGGPVAVRVLEAPIGPLLVAASGRGLLTVVFHADRRRARAARAALEARFGTGEASPAAAAHLETACAELSAYFAGELRAFTVPLDWSLATGFTRRVLTELATSVPFGSVVGYQELAVRAGETRGYAVARAVGAAMGANPLPVVVPCHRVVESDGGIGGFGGGLETKRALLALEGVLPAPLF